MSTVAFTPEFVERGYNNRAAVPEHPQWLARFAELSARARAALAPRLDLRYGPGPQETLDLFLPVGRARGTFVFLHGGYWRALDKSDFSFVAEPFVAQGCAVAVVNYDLCPDVSIATIVEECRRAVAWVVRDGRRRRAPRPRRHRRAFGGRASGGDDARDGLERRTDLARDPLAGAVSVSGVHDLAPLVQFSFNVDFRLDDAEAARLSPVRLPPRSRAPLVLAVGAAKPPSSFGRRGCCGTRGPPTGPPARACAADHCRPPPLQRDRRLRRPRERADAGDARALLACASALPALRSRAKVRARWRRRGRSAPRVLRALRWH